MGRRLRWSNEFVQEASSDVLIYGDRIGKLGRLVGFQHDAHVLEVRAQIERPEPADAGLRL